MKGLVIKSTGSWYIVKDVNGTVLDCRMKGKIRMEGSKNTNPVAVGDEVDFDIENDAVNNSGNDTWNVSESNSGNGIITRIYPRRNYIIRKATNLSKQSHIIAANIDRAFLLVTTSMPRTSTGFIDRFLITAEAYHIPASLIFSKIDIYGNDERVELEKTKRLYEKLGYSCFEASAVKGNGIAELKEIMNGKITLFAGHSGVGKSALVNALDPAFNLKTGNLSEAHSKGKHTTTFAELFELTDGGAVIDSPGIKEFGMFDLQKEELAHYFPEMKVLFNKCKYNSCLHLTEPGCAVKQAVEMNEIAESRYSTYFGIMTGGELNKVY